MKKYFGAHVSEQLNEWFCIIPNKVTVLTYSTPANKVTIKVYKSFSKKNVRNISIPYIPKPGRVSVISVIDHIVYTIVLFLMLPYILLSNGVIFIVPSYVPCAIIPFLKIFRKQIHLVVIDLQYPLYYKYLETGNPAIYAYWKMLDALEKASLRSATNVFSVSPYLQKEFSKHNRRSFLTPNGADTKSIDNIKPRRLFKEFTITYMGGLDYYRGIDILVNAFKIFKKRRKAKLLIMGGGRIDEFKKIAGSDEDIVFLDYVEHDKAISYCKGSDILAIPFRKHQLTDPIFTMKGFEYIACEVPIVATDTAEHVKLINDLGVGLVTEDNAAQFAKALEILATNKRLYQKLKKNCKNAKEKIDFKSTRRKYIEEVGK